jgi:hypothetical protein
MPGAFRSVQELALGHIVWYYLEPMIPHYFSLPASSKAGRDPGVSPSLYLRRRLRLGKVKVYTVLYRCHKMHIAI